MTSTRPASQEYTESPRAVRDRLIISGARLFAEKGYGGASVREICDHADTSMNMIHHYFGNKEGLFREVVGQLNEDVFVVPLQMLDRPVTSRDDFRSRFALIFETTLRAYIKNRDVLVAAVREQTDLPAIGAYMAGLGGHPVASSPGAGTRVIGSVPFDGSSESAFLRLRQSRSRVEVDLPPP